MNDYRILFAGLLITTFAPSAAWACSCDDYGINEFQVDSTGFVPANALGVPWVTNFPSIDGTRAGFVTVMQVVEDKETAVEFTIENPSADLYVIRPTNWDEGNTYRIQTEPTAENSYFLLPENRIKEIEIQVGPAIDASGVLPLVTSPAVSVTAQIEVLWGGCDVIFEATAIDISMEVGSDPAGFFFTTLVDGKIWAPALSWCAPNRPGESWAGRGQDQLVAVCDATPIEDGMLLPGSHTVQMQARLPGTDVIYSSEILTVDLDCPITEETPIESSSDADGCQTTHGSSPTVLLLLLGILGWRRRKASQ